MCEDGEIRQTMKKSGNWKKSEFEALSLRGNSPRDGERRQKQGKDSEQSAATHTEWELYPGGNKEFLTDLRDEIIWIRFVFQRNHSGFTVGESQIQAQNTIVNETFRRLAVAGILKKYNSQIKSSRNGDRKKVTF